MTYIGWLQILFYLFVIVLLVKPIGLYMARVYQGERTFLTGGFYPVERLFYRLAGVKPAEEMGWKTYTIAVLVFSLLGVLSVYLLQRLQAYLLLNPQGWLRLPRDHF